MSRSSFVVIVFIKLWCRFSSRSVVVSDEIHLHSLIVELGFDASQVLCGGGEQEDLDVVVVHGLWKVGDLVDWWKDDCYLSGTVREVNEEVSIELLPKPYGEGGSYDAVFKDLCPSLEWSLEDGWIVPFSKDGEKRQCAKLMKLPSEMKGEDETREEKKVRVKLVGDEGLALNIMESDSAEAAVMDLEEVVVRIEWIKGMLSLNVPNSETSTWICENGSIF
ncbi:unnamed protein product [Eruca vesicaria subsp. sativa]|uniref:Agenet domain-containing protein n=1 Tax=Eruca vesicaria subsp. sativa TaxID=29727 RepID=A0ABC8LR88_ERUVS|nr:unnamed protein product [Eruca vesicaria subsp. sativa]